MVPLDSYESSGSIRVLRGIEVAQLAEGELGIWELQPLLPEAGLELLYRTAAWKWRGKAALQVVAGGPSTFG